jgi:hypothetical protein
MPSLHGIRDVVIKDQCPEETMEGFRRQQWNKGLRCKMTDMSEEAEGIWQNLQEDRTAGNRKANSWVFDWAMGIGWTLWRGQPPPK